MISITMVDDISYPAPFNALPRNAVTEHRLCALETLFRQGDRPFAVFLLRQGAVSLIRHTEAGRKVTLFRARGGDMLAEASLFSEHYHCDCNAEQTSVVLAFDKCAVLRLMADDPAFSMAMVRRLSVQVQTYRRKLELLAIGSAKDRVLAGLADGWLTGTVLDFAGELGLSHEATYRALAALVTDGRIQKLGRGRYGMVSV